VINHDPHFQISWIHGQPSRAVDRGTRGERRRDRLETGRQPDLSIGPGTHMSSVQSTSPRIADRCEANFRTSWRPAAGSEAQPRA
jgi:hypothetical protein